MAGDETGPIGTIIRGIAGAIGGWWSGRAVADAAEAYGKEEDEFYRDRYEASPCRLADRSYQAVRPAYQLGHLARGNPEYGNRDFDSIEPELRAGWAEQVSSRHGVWDQVREFAREAYSRAAAAPMREGALRDRNSEESLGDDGGSAEARLDLPVSRR